MSPRHYHLSTAARRRISARLRGRHHKVRHGFHTRHYHLSAAATRRISKRLRGRHHHEKKHHEHRRRTRIRHTHRRHTTSRKRIAGSRRHVTHTPRRECIYPSHFRHGRTRMHSRFKHGKRIHLMRDPFKQGRRHLKRWR